MNRTKFYTNLVQWYHKCKLPKNQIEIDWNTVKFLDADLRNINRKKKIGKRIIVFISKEQKTKKDVVFYKEFSKHSDGGTKVIRGLLNELIKAGYRLRESKTRIVDTLDRHNPDVDTMKLKLKTRLF